ncbi:GDSL-type esterase/lipase family protein [Ruficoccus sp. ZRK36]|uniref:GDSL-type esterase/lipase family protein n=1 Tax=Ruficoccus sp. ZRK36 TaxID=2866311 RepID=UPI001C735172|nr:GDSL-type esterase/lipase family protein [Ruficoccus sp. ZRK36]QYY35028.1 hypothetical protein K0V07_12040 [Ruficoccus sp. ZRK36]
MKKIKTLVPLSAACVLMVFSNSFLTTASAETPSTAENPATTPATRNPWLDQHERTLRNVKAHPDAKLVFIGDSITQNWNSRGKDVWKERYSGLPAISLGVSGDKTENILWRLQHGELDGLDPALIVIMAGTNNIHRDTAEQIAEGIEAIVNEVLARCPDSQIVLMGIFPRGPNPRAPERPKIIEVNAIISELAADPQVEFLDIRDSLVDENGNMDRELFPDYLHPLAPGYVIWADALNPYLEKALSAPEGTEG